MSGTYVVVFIAVFIEVTNTGTVPWHESNTDVLVDNTYQVSFNERSVDGVESVGSDDDTTYVISEP